MATVTFQGPGGTDPVAHIVRLLADSQVNSDDLRLALERQKTRQVERTLTGTSVEGMFAPYSPAYAKRRMKAGRMPAPVDLLFSGRMMASLSVQVSGDEGRIGVFSNSEDATKAKVHNEGSARMPRRPWLEPSSADITAIAEDAARSAAARTRR